MYVEFAESHVVAANDKGNKHVMVCLHYLMQVYACEQRQAEYACILLCLVCRACTLTVAQNKCEEECTSKAAITQVSL